MALKTCSIPQPLKKKQTDLSGGWGGGGMAQGLRIIFPLVEDLGSDFCSLGMHMSMQRKSVNK